MSRSSLDCKIYVGDLPKDATEKDLQRAFEYYGPVKSVWVARNPPGFAFVEFDDSRDAEDAVRGLDNANVCGGRVRVEFSTGKSKPKPWLRRGGGGGGGGSGGSSISSRRPFDPQDRCYDCGERGHYAYDCRGRRRSRSRSRSPRRYNRSRSRSHSRDRYERSGRDRSRSDSRSPLPRRSRSRNRSSSYRRSPAGSDK